MRSTVTAHLKPGFMPTFIGDPGANRRRIEAWSAVSRDGQWGFTREEDVGTNWYIGHLATGFLAGQPYPSRRAAQRAVDTGDVLLDLWLTAATELHRGEHPTARAVVDWLAAAHPVVITVAEQRVAARRLRDYAARMRDVADDLTAARAADHCPVGDAVAVWALIAEHREFAKQLVVEANQALRAAAELWRTRAP